MLNKIKSNGMRRDKDGYNSVIGLVFPFLLTRK